ncbi:hypothetical protein EDC01DRAFT_782366 [Geopyxis carbonaria]|nr:hypothetical protein EDC01DRAFT_782366 [Geopyxis carbonaria]
MGLSSPTPQQLAVESWTMYSIGMAIILLRMYSRKLVLGSWKNFQLEDYIMMLDACIYTILMAAINVSGRTATNLLEPGQLETLTPEDIETRIYGSKIVILLEQAMLITTWLTKACMLLLYHRLSQRLPHRRIIHAIAAYVVLGFIGVELAWFLSCRPFNGYWALPVPDPQCATYQHYSITQATFNISSDLMMLAVGLPLLLKAKVDLRKKALLVGMFGLGVFVVLAAVLNKYFNFSNPLTTVYMLWYIRESSTAIYIANIPLLWPLVRRTFKAGRFAEPGSNSYGTAGQSHKRVTGVGGSASHEMSTRRSRGKAGESVLDRSWVSHSQSAGSEERIVHDGPLEIDKRVSFTIEEGERGEGEGATEAERYGRPPAPGEGEYKASVVSGLPRGMV